MRGEVSLAVWGALARIGGYGQRAEIIELSGASERATDNALRRLIKCGLVIRTGYGMYSLTTNTFNQAVAYGLQIRDKERGQ